MKKYDYFKNITEENLSEELTQKNIDKTRNCLIEEINKNELMGKKHKKVFTSLYYIENFLILASAITECATISNFASLVHIPIRITSYAIGLKISEILAGIKKVND